MAGVQLVVVALLFSWLASAQTCVFSNDPDAQVVVGQPAFQTHSVGRNQTAMEFPTGVAVSPTTGKLFVCDTSNNRMLRFPADPIEFQQPAEAVFGAPNFTSFYYGTTKQLLNFPYSAFVDSDDNLWVTDSSNSRVVAFSSASTCGNFSKAFLVLGQPSFTAGNGSTIQTGMRSPTGVFMDNTGTLWVADTGNSRVLRFDNAASLANGAPADQVLGQSGFSSRSSGDAANQMSFPSGVAVDSSGNLFVADQNNNRVLRFDNAKAKGNGGSADAVLGQTGFNMSDGGFGPNRFNQPVIASIDSQGDRLFVSDSNNNRVLVFDNASSFSNGQDASLAVGQPSPSSGNQTNQGGEPAANTLNIPQGVIFSPTRNWLWIADQFNSRVLGFCLDQLAL